MKISSGLVARNHFAKFDHDGPMIASYTISDDGKKLVIARPGYGAGQRISSVVEYTEEYKTIMNYVQSIMDMWGVDNLLIKMFEVTDDEVV